MYTPPVHRVVSRRHPGEAAGERHPPGSGQPAGERAVPGDEARRRAVAAGAAGLWADDPSRDARASVPVVLAPDPSAAVPWEADPADPSASGRVDPSAAFRRQPVAPALRRVRAVGPCDRTRLAVVRRAADQVRGNVDAVEIVEVPDNLTVAHPPGIHRDDLLVEAREPALVFGDELRVKTGQAVSRDGQVELAAIRRHGLAAIAVAAVSGAVLADQMTTSKYLPIPSVL